MFKGGISNMQQMMKQVQKMMHQFLKVSPREDSPNMYLWIKNLLPRTSRN
jgi:hypothetical protein